MPFPAPTPARRRQRVTKNTAGSIDEVAARAAPRVGALVLSLLIGTDLDYEAIVAEVRRAVPGAKTTARSVASAASIARKKGEAVAVRRKPASLVPSQKVAMAKSGKPPCGA